MRQDQAKDSAVTALRPSRMTLRLAVSLLVLGLITVLLWERLAELDPVAITAAIALVHPVEWTFAVIATVISFAAIGQYDVVVHRHMATGLPAPQARRAGMAAIAVGQVLGLGVVTGTVLRWRMLPGQDLRQAATVTAHVTALFLAGWAVVTALALLILPGAPMSGVALPILAALAVLILLPLVWPALNRLPVRLPNLLTWGRLIPLAAVDVIAAALALWLLGPTDLPFLHLLPAFLIALGAGLISGTPGGIGVFEVTLLSLLPGTEPEPVLAAVLAWRLIYHAIPAVIGAVAALLLPGGRQFPQPAVADLAVLAAAPRAETGLLHQGALTVCPLGPDAACLTGRTAHHLIALFDPVQPDRGATPFAPALAETARAEARRPALYKCSARPAVQARAAGWATLRIAREAVLTPKGFTLSTPDRASLRRKLRHAAKAGISIAAPGALPLEDLARIAEHWSRVHRGERGFSMGRFDPAYLRHQRVFIACRAGRPVAFASFHTAAKEWTLDLMRYDEDTPDGTMHALIVAALAEAARLAIPRLSLAAVPDAAFAKQGSLTARIAARFTSATGLLRFKSSFAPHWQPLYLCAPDWPALLTAAAAIGRAVHFPAPLSPAKNEYRIARGTASWQCEAIEHSV